MRVATQNINWGGEPTAPGCSGEPRLARLVPRLAELAADILVLTEFKAGPLEDELRALLVVAGYPHLLSHPQGPFSLGTAIAAREPLKSIELPVPSTTEPWRSIGVSMGGVDVFGFYFPLGDAKQVYWDWLLANAEELRDRNVILLGDFNTGKVRADEAGDTFDCQDRHEALESLGFVDLWRAMYPKGRDYTWYSSAGNGFRLDYIWASPSLAPLVRRVWHDHEVRLELHSDHSSVVAEFSIPNGSSMTDLIASTEAPNVLKNIFKLTEFGGAEDRFTAAWGYVLEREPALAQAVANTLLKGRGLTAKVIGVEDHPAGYDSLDRPDFLIQCEEFDILVEHKLDALLGARQLERYLQLAPQRTWVALIAPAYQSVPAEVLIDPRYLMPEGKEHFRWSDFYDAVKSQPGWLAQEFADYMKSLGMAPFTLKANEDIFDKRVRPVQFEEALKLAADHIFAKTRPGCWLKGTPTGLGCEVRAPSANLTLIYVWAEQYSKCVRDSEGLVFAVNVFERDIAGKDALESATLRTPSGMSVHRRRVQKHSKQGEGTCRITYAAPLAEVIQETREASVLHMAEILALVRDDFIESQVAR